VKSAPFRYVAPEDLDEVIEALSSSDESRVIAGGQSLVPMMAMRLAQPDLLVDVMRVPSLARIHEHDDAVEIGAAVSQTALATRGDVHPLVREAIALIAHPQIRNRGTVVGSLAHADPAAELPAVAVALDARLRVLGGASERWIPASEFFDSYFTTALEPGEIAMSVEFPAPARREGWAIEEVARRYGDFALAGVVARLVVDDELVVRDVAVVPFAVADRPRPSAQAAHALVDGVVTPEAITAAANAAAEELEPPSDVHAGSQYRRRAVAVLCERALSRALEVAARRSR